MKIYIIEYHDSWFQGKSVVCADSHNEALSFLRDDLTIKSNDYANIVGPPIPIKKGIIYNSKREWIAR